MSFIVTPKQLKIIYFALDGLSNRQIGERLGNTQGGIEQQMVKVFRKIKEGGGVVYSRRDLRKYNFTAKDRRLRGQSRSDSASRKIRSGS